MQKNRITPTKDKGKRYTMGIDPGVATGVCLYDRQERKIVLAETLDFHGTIDLCRKDYPPDTVDIIIEDCRAHRSLYARYDAKGGMKLRRIAQNVGQVKRETGLLIESLRRLGYTVVTEVPISHKWDSETLRRITGWTKRTSQHARDAVKLAYGVHRVRVQEVA